VKNDQEYAAATRKLDELAAQLKIATDKTGRMESLSSRYAEDARAYLRIQPRVWDLQPEHIGLLPVGRQTIQNLRIRVERAA
jgi:hypothetical protein